MGIQEQQEDTLARDLEMLVATSDPEHDPVNRPSHYVRGGIEVLDAIEAWGLHENFYLGNVIKYVARAGHKGEALPDLKKARFYLDRQIKRMENGSPS